MGWKNIQKSIYCNEIVVGYEDYSLENSISKTDFIKLIQEFEPEEAESPSLAYMSLIFGGINAFNNSTTTYKLKLDSQEKDNEKRAIV